ncbi:MAG: hypothetical protein PUC65_11835 [Clostridiales bacterium]|nr:hypothetical protein [Clostridiales bacterium]
MIRSSKLRAGITTLAVLFFAVILTFAWKASGVNADSVKVVVQKINYEDSTITIKANPGDTKVFFSDKAGKKWEAIPGTLSSNQEITMDISWIPVSANYTIKFKGDHSQSVVTVVLPKQVTNFKAKYNRVKKEMTYTNGEEKDVEWRKKDSYIWKSITSSSAFISELERLSAQGATIYLRLKSVNGGTTNGLFTTGQRASKEVTLAIPKKAEAPTITIDGSKFLIPVKKNSSYRIVNENDTETDWKSVSTASDLMISDIAPSVLYGGTQKEVKLQFRINATNSTAASRVTTVTVPVQAGPPSQDTYGISLEYTSSSSLDLTVKSASATQPFEYTIVNPEDTFDYQQLTWTSITSSAKVPIKEEKAKEGSHIYVRKKSIAKTDKTEFAFASKELDVTGSTGVSYPNPANTDKLTTLVAIAGNVKEEDAASYLTFTINSPTKTTVSSIEFKDKYGDTKGTLTTLKSTVMKDTNNASNYIITTKITSTESLDKFTEQALFGTIALANGDEVESSETSGIKLYIYPKTVVNNTDNKTYTANFERVFKSNDTKNDPDSFTFNLDFGKMYEHDKNGLEDTSKEVMISKMVYDGYVLTNTDYSVAYDNEKFNQEHEKIRKAVVTVNVGMFEKNSAITKRNAAVPLIIYLSNGEKIENAVTIELVETATVEAAPVAYSITEGSLEETKTETITNEDKTTSSITKEVVTFSLKLNIFSPTYDVGVSDVTWDGISIMKSAEISGGVATIALSNPKINKLTTGGQASKTANIEIKLSNGFVIDKGCKLTIIKKN